MQASGSRKMRRRTPSWMAQSLPCLSRASQRELSVELGGRDRIWLWLANKQPWMEGVRCPACPASSIIHAHGARRSCSKVCSRTQLGRPGNTRTESQSRKFLVMDTTMPCHLRHLAFRGGAVQGAVTFRSIGKHINGIDLSCRVAATIAGRDSHGVHFDPFFPPCTPTKRAWVPLEGRVMVGNLPCAGQRIICRGCR